jgi:hypothetical protein
MQYSDWYFDNFAFVIHELFLYTVAAILRDQVELQQKVTRIANTGIHAVAAGWDVLVCGVAGEKYPVEAVALGDQKMRRPGTCEQPVGKALEAAPA